MNLEIGLVYLQREPTGLKNFEAACETVSTGIRYALLVVRKGRGLALPLPKHTCDSIDVSDEFMSLWAFGRAIETWASHCHVLCLLNSWSRPQHNGWLEKLVYASLEPGVGLVGATGSFESLASQRRFRFIKRLLFPPYPNAHLRTNALCARSELLLKVWPAYFNSGLPGKAIECFYESGRRSISKRVMKLSENIQMVTADGRYFPWQWPSVPGRFRSGIQGAVLVADNQTDAYTFASRDQQHQMERAAWGRAL